MVYFEKKSMDVERREGIPQYPEIGERGSELTSFSVHASEAPRGGEDVAVLETRRQAAAQAARTSREMKDQLLVRIESALSEGLEGEYQGLSAEKKRLFKDEGEKLSLWLHDAIATGKLTSREVLERMENWLLIIEAKDRSSPWLLQEAYVRARRVIRDFMYTSAGH